MMKRLQNWFLITVSILIMAIGVYFFKFPHNFVFGGVTGFAVVVAKVFPITTGAFTFVANAILLLIGIIFLGKEFAIKTTYASVLLSALLVVFEKICPLNQPISGEPMLDLVFAIALPAIGSALLFQLGASSGGTDVIALLVKKYTTVQDIGMALFISDLVMILVACFVFDVQTALFSFVGLTVKSFLIDGILENMNRRKVVTIVCDECEPICDYITGQLNKGATITEGIGAYSHQKKYVVYSTLTRHQAALLRNYIRDHQFRAFVSVASTSEVFGKGFASL